MNPRDVQHDRVVICYVLCAGGRSFEKQLTVVVGGSEVGAVGCSTFDLLELENCDTEFGRRDNAKPELQIGNDTKI